MSNAFEQKCMEKLENTKVITGVENFHMTFLLDVIQAILHSLLNQLFASIQMCQDNDIICIHSLFKKAVNLIDE